MAEQSSPAIMSQTEAQAAPPAAPGASAAEKSKPGRKPLHEVYKLPVPVRTFPLPTFYPSNPISLLHLAWAWASQFLFPPPAEPSVIYEGLWSPSSRSVNVVDPVAIRALWEQGFYGKGNLSRSEPNWLKREKVRRGLVQSHVSEVHTVNRREERIKMKWERARLEQEAIRQTRLEEAQLAAASRAAVDNPIVTPDPVAIFSQLAPVGPSELLALPNSAADLVLPVTTRSTPKEHLNGNCIEVDGAPVSTDELVEKPTLITNGLAGIASNGIGQDINGSAAPGSSASDASEEQKTLKRRKSVRFSPKVESTTFDHTDPPSPGRAQVNGSTNGMFEKSARPAPAVSENGARDQVEQAPEAPVPEDIADKEHLQLTAEEAFFLHFALGCLKVKQPSGKEHIGTADLLKTLRQTSEFPPRAEAELQPDDSFLVNYAVYHHFRSLGWVPRPGIKFAMDWMLYAKGPVFNHAEFGVIVMPSYSDPWWKHAEPRTHHKSWHWLHGVVRVLSHVMKSLVLVYVDVPSPSAFDEALAKGPAEVFKLYKIREVMVKRWSPNRNR